MSLLDKLKKNSKISKSAVLAESEFFGEREICPTAIPALNIALSGDVDGGIGSGLHMLAGPSKHYKTSIALYLASAYLKRYKDAVLLFLDCEFGSPKEYFATFGIDTKRVFHVPFSNLEELKFEIMSQLDNITEEDKVFILVDSLGSASSLKEYQDSLDGKSVADMSRAKAIKSITRLVTPHLTMKDIPMVAVSHTYAELGCLDGDTVLKTKRGFIKIKDVVVGDVVLTMNGSQNVLKCFGPNDIEKEGKTFLKITLDDGSVIKCTGNHKFYMIDGKWKEAGDLKIGDEFF